MTITDQYKSIVRAYADLFSRGRFEEILDLCTPDVVVHGVLGQGGPEVFLPVWEELRMAFGQTLDIEDIIAEGDMVAVRIIERGTFRGTFRGMAPTGKSYAITAMEWFRFSEDGRIAERWGARDSAAILRQVQTSSASA